MARPFPSPLARIIGEIQAATRRDASIGPALLTQFVATHSEDAFRGLVQRYAPLVWVVCERCLRDPNDAEDAFQATFIVLARNASRISPPERVSVWLHAVAVRVAKRVRAQSARRRQMQGATLPKFAVETDPNRPELREVLDEELLRLPEDLRQAFILCCIEERTHAEAATFLGCARRTVCTRVAKATELLKERLGRRGLAPVGALSGTLIPRFGSAEIPEAVLGRLAKEPSSSALAAAEAVIHEMWGHWWWWSLGVVSLLVTGVGVGVLAGTGPVAPVNLSAPSAAAVPVAGPRVDGFGDPLPAGALARLGSAAFNHLGAVNRVAFLADGKNILSASDDGTVRVWDAATGREQSKIALEGKRISVLAWSGQ
jgi:RNA polymerase sigma factor (sigma-70 family)